MTILELSQTILNFLASLVIIVVGVFISVICLEIIKLTNRIKKISNDARQELSKLQNSLAHFFELLLKLSSKVFKTKKHGKRNN